ncbi:hypothetical protein Q5P01_017688 [Channa striata]|uniref:Uncharacterized protein n=1 Tax=Channa striata TaxID=64152 RepID=A0AA88M9U5_CHASR|nr:hypothetical protein Q5P01_017688 [Channa striata]
MPDKLAVSLSPFISLSQRQTTNSFIQATFATIHPQTLEASSPHTRSPLSPGTGTQSRHSYSGSASEGAGERASLWKLGNSRILVLNRRPPFLSTEVPPVGLQSRGTRREEKGRQEEGETG